MKNPFEEERDWRDTINCEFYEFIDFLYETDSSEINKKMAELLFHLLKRVEQLEWYRTCVHELIPVKYRKLNPSADENPFFSQTDMYYTPDKGKEAIERLKKWKERSERSNDEEK